jgi:hypothetical protein
MGGPPASGLVGELMTSHHKNNMLEVLYKPLALERSFGMTHSKKKERKKRKKEKEKERK